MGHENYPPISAYGLIGNCRTAALVSKHGSIDWCCFPRFDSPSYFAALLDRERGGEFFIRPEGEYSSTQRYIDETNVLETSFETATGVVRLLDCFTVTSEERKANRLWPDQEILRLVEGVRGEVKLRLRFAPRGNYGCDAIRLRHRGKLGLAALHEDHLLTLRCEHEGFERTTNGHDHEFSDTFVIRQGESRCVSLVYTADGPAVIPPLGDSARARLSETMEYWRSWAARSRYSGIQSELVVRSALALKLLSFAPSGAIIAAPTTSLPEVLGGIRNWDYRYCWLRDASFTVRALVNLSYHEEANAFISWMLHTTRQTRPQVQVLYSVYGYPRVREKELSWLEGYAGSKPVRIGNDAHHQFQLDVYGEVLDAFYTYSPYVDSVDGDTRRFLIGLGEAICDLWDKPDDGIWEDRSERTHHTHSKVQAWVGLNRLCRLSRKYHWAKAPLAHWEKIQEQIRTAVELHGYNAELGTYTRSFDDTALDASLLIMPLVGFCDAASPRMQSTCDAIIRELSRNRLVYRYREVNDGLEGEEGAFGLCNFWLAEVLAKSGRLDEAMVWFEEVIRLGNSLGLFPEEFDPATGTFLGNYPQGFTHIGLINAAITLAAEARKQEEKAA